jgi:hypothetical protein
MIRTPIITILIAIVTFAMPAASAAPQPGNNRAGMAQSSRPASDRDSGTTTPVSGMGSGRATTPPTTSPEAAIKQENEILDSKLKGICRGC